MTTPIEVRGLCAQMLLEMVPPWTFGPSFEQAGFPRARAGRFKAEFAYTAAVRHDRKIVLIEIKTGDPDLPLPSSTNSQMLIMKDKLKAKHADAEVVPVVVTNYKLDDAGLKELSTDGIKVIPIPAYNYDSKLVSDQLTSISRALIRLTPGAHIKFSGSRIGL